jgi:hypothetical protein
MAHVQPKLENEARAIEAHFDKETRLIVVRLQGGTVLKLPVHKLQGLANASDRDITAVELMPQGAALHWETLDLDLSISGLAAGVFGTRAWMVELGRKGGSATTPAKGAASRINGLKGGRPRKAGAQPYYVLASKSLTLNAILLSPGIDHIDLIVSNQSHQPTKSLIRYKHRLARLELNSCLNRKNLRSLAVTQRTGVVSARIEGIEDICDATLAPAA